MPVAVIDIPSGLPWGAKEQLHKEVAESIHDAYQMPDTRVYLREWTPEQTSFDGLVGGSFRPMCNLIVPPILTAEGRKMLASRVSSAIAKACDLRADVVPLPGGEQVSTRWVLLFFFEVPLELAALDGIMAFENPMVPKGKH